MRQPGHSTPALPPTPTTVEAFPAPPAPEHKVFFVLVIEPVNCEPSVQGLGTDPKQADLEARKIAACWDGDPDTWSRVTLLKVQTTPVGDGPLAVILDSRRYKTECLTEDEWDARFPREDADVQIVAYKALGPTNILPVAPVVPVVYDIRDVTLFPPGPPSDEIRAEAERSRLRKAAIIEDIEPLLKQDPLDPRAIKAMLGFYREDLFAYPEVWLQDLLEALQEPHTPEDDQAAAEVIELLDATSLDTLQLSWVEVWNDPYQNLHPRARRVVYDHKEAQKARLFREKDQTKDPKPLPQGGEAPVPSPSQPQPPSSSFQRSLFKGPEATCSSCGARIHWGKTERGSAVPLDADHQVVTRLEPDTPDTDTKSKKLYVRIFDGTDITVRLVDTWPTTLADPDAVPGYVTHFFTCPNASKHRRKKR